jgi:MoxR-like ATPase
MPKKNKLANNSNNEDSNIILSNVLSPDILSIITPAEERRLKAELKNGIDINQSIILKNIITRCPTLKINLCSIVKISPKSDNDISRNKNESNQQPIQDIFDNPNDIISDDNSENKNKYQTMSQNRKKNSNKRPYDTINVVKSNNNCPSRKRSKYSNSKNTIKKDYYCDKKLNTYVEILGSDDTTDTTDSDTYEINSFVVNDSSDEDLSDFNQVDLDRELNDLCGNYIKINDETNDEMNRIQTLIREIRTEYLQNKVDISMILKANFSKDDAIWFYKNIKRMSHLDASEKFKLEDIVEKRYKLLTSLQKAGMYTKFTKGVERDIMHDILASKHSDSVKSVLINRMCNVSYESIDEYQKALNWMDTILSIPTDTKSSNNNIDKSIKTLYDNLTTRLYGMDSTIREILQAVCTILNDPDNKGYILALVGPPGVGKTTISSMISEAIGMGFGQISCGSINDQATITGHGSTYIGSTPGVFTQYLINNGQLDNVILLDEMDKIHNSKIIPILLHILDKSQNSRFRDAFCPEVTIDLSKNLYIVAVNSIDGLDRALTDRLKIVNVTGYDIDAKTQICIKHIIPHLNTKTGIKLLINDETVKRYVFKVSPNVSGVRDIERFFGDIYEKLLLVQTMGPTYFGLPKSFDIKKLKTIDTKLIKQLIGI